MNFLSKNHIPTKVVTLVKVIIFLPHFLYETIYRMLWNLWNSYSIVKNETVDLAELSIVSHILEKGITMPERRLGFGYDNVRGVIRRIKQIIIKYSSHHIEIQSAISDLEQYYKIHKEAKFELPADIDAGINEILKYKQYETQPCFEITKDEYSKETNNFAEFANQRHSVRWYSDDPVTDEEIAKVIKLAQSAPSACNRQGTKVYVISTEAKKKEVLKLQNGNRGFGDMADKLLLITNDMSFWKYSHRPLAITDSGIFTMNLLYALHYYNICACTLNAVLSIKKERKLQKIVGYSKSEFPVVFISIGHAPNKFMIAGSQRLKIEQIYKIV